MDTKYLIRSRLDCPPGNSQQQLREKEALAKKLAARLNQAERNVRLLVSERRHILRLLNDLIRSTSNQSENFDDSLDFELGNRIVEDGNRLVSMFSRPESDGDVLLLSEQYLNYLGQKCVLVKRSEKEI